MKKILLLLVILSACSTMKGQSFPFYSVGAEIQWYPAGFQFMITGEYALASHHALQGKLGYNLARRQDFSPFNDLENGGGFGVTLGYRYYFSDENKGVFAGVNTDLWKLTIDWEDADDLAKTGTTNILVLQPTGEAGYMYAFKDSPLSIDIHLAAGYEINIVTEGAAVGEGAIILLGARIKYMLGYE